MYVLDTDSITHDQNAHPVLIEKIKRTPRSFLFTTSITVEEQLKGRLAYLGRHKNSPRPFANGHHALVQTLTYFSRWSILIYREEIDALFRTLRKQRLRIGSQDLRIAATALTKGFTVVTSNLRDFSQVPNLKVVDWTIPDQHPT